MEYGPSHNREDLRYGDPHARRGKQRFYGPDSYDQEPKQKPTLVSHGFYSAEARPEKPSLWKSLKAFLYQRH